MLLIPTSILYLDFCAIILAIVLLLQSSTLEEKELN